jgi:acyl dehydratase
MLDLSYQGKDFPGFEFEVDRCKIRELCMAIGDDNPIFFDRQTAEKEGYKDNPAPLTFATVMNFWGYPKIWDNMKEIGIDTKRLLHAKEDYEYFSPIYPGDVITGKVNVDSLRSSSSMDMATFKTVFLRNNETVLIAKMTIVVMAQAVK